MATDLLSPSIVDPYFVHLCDPYFVHLCASARYVPLAAYDDSAIPIDDHKLYCLLIHRIYQSRLVARHIYVLSLMIFQLAVLSVSPCDLLMRADAQRVQRAVREDTAVSGDGLALPVPFITSYYLSIGWEDAHIQWLSVVI